MALDRKKGLSGRQKEGEIAPSSRYSHLLANSDASIHQCITSQRGEEPLFLQEQQATSPILSKGNATEHCVC